MISSLRACSFSIVSRLRLRQVAQRDEAVADLVVGDREDGVLGLIEDDVGLLLGLVGGRQNLVGREDQVPERRLLLDDPRVVLDVGRARHAVDERGDVGRAADLVELAGSPELLFERDQIDGVAALGQLDHLVEDAPVRVAEEIVRVDHLGGEVERVVVQQDRAEHGAFGFEIVRKRAFGDGGVGHDRKWKREVEVKLKVELQTADGKEKLGAAIGRRPSLRLSTSDF